jgi:hypothetical protein
VEVPGVRTIPAPERVLGRVGDGGRGKRRRGRVAVEEKKGDGERRGNEEEGDTFMPEDCVGRAWKEAGGAREIRMAESRRDDLDKDFIRLDVVEIDLLELELAV